MPETDAPPVPGAALEAAEDAAGAAGEAAGEAAEQAAESGGEKSVGIVDALMSTEPDVDPRAVAGQFGLGPAASNAFVGAQKVIHGLTGYGKAGTTALENFVVAGVHAARDGLGRGDQDDDRDDEQRDGDDDQADDQRGPELGDRGDV